MRVPLLVLVVALATAGAARGAEAPPAAAEVRAFMARVEDASRSRDLARIAAVLAPDCRIELTSTVAGQEHVSLLTRAEYIEILTTGFAALKDLEKYDYRVSGLEIAFDTEPPGATVVAQVHETFVLNGRAFATDSRETSRVERRAGELKLVAVSAETQGR